MADDRHFEMEPPQKSEAQEASEGTGASDGSGVSLLGEEGQRVADTMAAIAIGDVKIADLADPRFSREPDGTLAVFVDEASFQVLNEADG